MNVLPVRPVIFFCGDFSQQQPIATVAGRTMPVDGITKHPSYHSLFHRFHLTEQHRCTDSQLMRFLSAIKHHQPSTDALEHFQQGRILCRGQVTATVVIEAYKPHPSALFLTVSNSATSFINNSIIDSYSALPIIASVICYNDLNRTSIFHGMPLMLLQNRRVSALLMAKLL